MYYYKYSHDLPSMTTISKRSLRRLLADILYKGDLLSILWTIVVGQMKKILSSSPSPPIWNQRKQSYLIKTLQKLSLQRIFSKCKARSTTQLKRRE